MNGDLCGRGGEKKGIHVRMPTAADIGDDVIERVYFLHSAVRRGVLGNQDKVPRSCKIGYGERRDKWSHFMYGKQMVSKNQMRFAHQLN